MAVTPLPIPPSRADAENFAERADTFLGALPVFADELNVVQVDVNTKQLLAASSETNAAASALASANTAAATIWVSGTTYAVGANRFSPINFLTYRRKTAGAGTTDPSLDSTNWALLTGLGDATLTGTQTFTGTKTFNNIASATIGNLNGGQLAGLRNRIINGSMDVSQRGTSFPAVTGTYTLDRFIVNNVSDGVVTAAQVADGPLNELLFSLRTTVTTADVSIAAGQVGRITQRIEGYNARELIGKTLTLSFWVRSSKTGTHCIALSNAKSYVAEYAIGTANTWEKKTITISGGAVAADTSERTSGTGLIVDFTYFCGSAFQTTANSWQIGQFFGTANQVNCLDTVGNIFAITGVQLEVGPVATPFEHRPYGMELALCQRYFQTGYSFNFVPASDSANVNTRSLAVPMRATPTFTGTPASGTGAIVGGSSTGFSQNGLHSVTANVPNVTASAEL